MARILGIKGWLGTMQSPVHDYLLRVCITVIRQPGSYVFGIIAPTQCHVKKLLSETSVFFGSFLVSCDDAPDFWQLRLQNSVSLSYYLTWVVIFLVVIFLLVFFIRRKDI